MFPAYGFTIPLRELPSPFRVSLSTEIPVHDVEQKVEDPNSINEPPAVSNALVGSIVVPTVPPVE